MVATSARARLVPPALVLTSALGAQFGAAFAVRMFAYTSPVAVAWARNTVGALLLLAILLLRRGSLRGIRPRPAIALGLILGTMNASFYEALNHLHLGDAVAVEFVGPIAVATLTARRRREMLWILLAALGVLAISRPGQEHLDYLGLAFVLVAALCWALYILVGRRVAIGGRRADSLVAAMLLSSAWLLLPALLRSASTLTDPRVLLFGIGVGVLSSALPYSVELMALERVPPTVFGILLSMQPVVAGLMGFLLLGQTVNLLEGMGFVFVVTASVGATLTSPADLPPPA